MNVPEANVQYLGRNVINNAAHFTISERSILEKKSQSTIILFIGREKYLEGARLLIDAFQKFNSSANHRYSLHIIGLQKESVEETRLDNVFFYGYLDKADENDNSIYYTLLSEARLVINPTPGWAGYSSIIEALYYYTPIIISPFLAFKDEFGDSLPFGQFFHGNDSESLAKCIQESINPPHFREMCLAAHFAVKDYTWDAYVDDLLRYL